ncbi:hypothetical protein PR048_014357 [Dryococelus australis]|uniref:Ribosomal protein S3 n=1 Tax=Dryococelus australis TaxID=614101 RepID=A0ABQ9HED9_9NEOP|nr:hypothetical protein PR048_014357 [Dryococelus australis]
MCTLDDIPIDFSILTIIYLRTFKKKLQETRSVTPLKRNRNKRMTGEEDEVNVLANVALNRQFNSSLITRGSRLSQVTPADCLLTATRIAGLSVGLRVPRMAGVEAETLWHCALPCECELRAQNPTSSLSLVFGSDNRTKFRARVARKRSRQNKSWSSFMRNVKESFTEGKRNYTQPTQPVGKVSAKCRQIVGKVSAKCRHIVGRIPVLPATVVSMPEDSHLTTAIDKHTEAKRFRGFFDEVVYIRQLATRGPGTNQTSREKMIRHQVLQCTAPTTNNFPVRCTQSDEVGMEQRWSTRVAETGDTRDNPLTNGIFRHERLRRESSPVRIVIINLRALDRGFDSWPLLFAVRRPLVLRPSRRRGFTSGFFACENRAGRCRMSESFLEGLPFPLVFSLLHSGAALRFALIDSQDLDVKSGPDHFTYSPTIGCERGGSRGVPEKASAVIGRYRQQKTTLEMRAREDIASFRIQTLAERKTRRRGNGCRNRLKLSNPREKEFAEMQGWGKREIPEKTRRQTREKDEIFVASVTCCLYRIGYWRSGFFFCFDLNRTRAVTIERFKGKEGGRGGYKRRCFHSNEMTRCPLSGIATTLVAVFRAL